MNPHTNIKNPSTFDSEHLRSKKKKKEKKSKMKNHIQASLKTLTSFIYCES